MKRHQNLALLLGVLFLMALPLAMVQKPDIDGAEIFTGADSEAQELIQKISPDYVPWAKPIMTPPSKEVESLLFALQASLGAGFIGYYLGCAVTRARLAKERETERC